MDILPLTLSLLFYSEVVSLCDYLPYLWYLRYLRYLNQLSLIPHVQFQLPEVKCASWCPHLFSLWDSPLQPFKVESHNSENMIYTAASVHLPAAFGLQRSFSELLICKGKMVLNPLALFLEVFPTFLLNLERVFCSVITEHWTLCNTFDAMIWPRCCWEINSPKQRQQTHIHPISLLHAIFIAKHHSILLAYLKDSETEGGPRWQTKTI